MAFCFSLCKPPTTLPLSLWVTLTGRGNLIRACSQKEIKQSLPSRWLQCVCVNVCVHVRVCSEWCYVDKGWYYVSPQTYQAFLLITAILFSLFFWQSPTKYQLYWWWSRCACGHNNSFVHSIYLQVVIIEFCVNHSFNKWIMIKRITIINTE